MSLRKRSIDVLLLTKVWPLTLLWFCALAIPLADASAQTNKREIVKQASQSYYNLRRLGLLEFKAVIQPNWALMAKNSEPNPEGLKMLNGLAYSLYLWPDGSVKVVQESSVPVSSVHQEDVKKISAGLDQMLGGFFLTWNLFMQDSPFPAVESEYQLQALDSKYFLTYKESNADVMTTMTRELSISEINVSSPAFKSSIKPQLTKTPKGYVLTGYQATYEPAAGPGKTELTIQLDYQEVSGLQLPRKLTLDAIYDGAPVHLELQFSQYQLKLTDSGVPRKSN